MAKINYSSWQQYSNRSNNQVDFFSIKEDGGSAIVRFMESDPNDYEIIALHNVKDGQKFKKISCIRNPYDPIDNCPLCSDGNKVQYRFFVKLLKYENENGEIVTKSCVWERPMAFAEKLNSLVEEYGDLKDNLFRVVKHGSGRDTTYDVLYAPATKYPNAQYPIETKALSEFVAFGRIVKDWGYDEIVKFMGSQDTTQQATQQEPVVQKSQSVFNDSIGGLPPMDLVRDDYVVPKFVPPVEQETQPAISQDAAQQPARQRKPWEVPTSTDGQDQQFTRPNRPKYY